MPDLTTGEKRFVIRFSIFMAGYSVIDVARAIPNAGPTPEAFYAAQGFERHAISDATLAVRVFGQGPALVFIHGFPTHGYTWRKQLIELSSHYRCYVIDLPGLGDSGWTGQTDFSFTAQASRVVQLCRSLGLNKFALVAHDTGATIARLVAIAVPDNVSHLIMLNTEIPNHRPPWVSTYQFLARLPGAGGSFRLTMRSRLWRNSSLGFKEFYTDKSLLEDAENLDPYLAPLLRSPTRMAGFLGYLKGIEWSVVDNMAENHAQILAKPLFLWGANDNTFPLALAKRMCGQFNQIARLVSLPASLLPHEECPELVNAHIREFMSS